MIFLKLVFFCNIICDPAQYLVLRLYFNKPIIMFSAVNIYGIYKRAGAFPGSFIDYFGVLFRFSQNAFESVNVF